MNFSSRIYANAGRLIAKRFFNAPQVLAVYARRSVAAGEAVFPWSDLDLEILVNDTSAPTLLSLLNQFQKAKLYFPRLGESFVVTPEEAVAKAKLDPYRASLDRRAALLLHGHHYPLPHLPIPRQEAARRLIFWFEHFIPTAIQTNNRRNQRKFLLEIRNAFGVLNGDWPEPFLTRRETQAHTGPMPDNPIAECRRLALEAAQMLGHASQEALLIHTQNPFLWTASTNIPRPPHEVFLHATRRYLSPERLRAPGFLGEAIHAPAIRLAKVQRALERPTPHATSHVKTLRDYYTNEYPRLALIRDSLAQTLPPIA
jgi:hypothetical protein